MENSKSSMGLKVALGIALVLFLGTGFYTMNLYKESNETKKELTAEKQLVMNDLNAMAKQYDVAISENSVANANLTEARERIQGLIDSLKISDKNVKTLWRFKKKYQSLQKEMDVLLAQNDSLRVENSYLATSLDSTRVRLEERTMFTDSLLVQNTALAEVVENAAVLSTAGLKGFGVIVRSSGKLIPTERARRTDKVRVCYTVTKNSLVLAGDKEFFVQVLDPNDNVLGLNEQIQFEEKVLNYSLISKFNYESKNLDICEFIEPRGDASFDKGRYVINIFSEMDLVSTSEFTLE